MTDLVLNPKPVRPLMTGGAVSGAGEADAVLKLKFEETANAPDEFRERTRN